MTKNMLLSDYEVLAPVGSYECLAAAIHAHADAIYFGVEQLNMRSHSANKFTIADLSAIAEQCREHHIRSYLTVNTIIYDDDLPMMRTILDAAHAAGISAIIATDIAVMTYCHRIGLPVHLSTQLNISNIEAVRFFAKYADVVVLARELTLTQVAYIAEQIAAEHLCGPSGELIRIEMFCHGALCMAVSGKCYLSLDNMNRSANRGECMQLCRRSYTVTDDETGTQLNIDQKYIMSPKDLKTIRFLDKMVAAGVRVFKIEGRARGPEYVHTTVTCYKAALDSIVQGTFTEEKKDMWDGQLATVFNRGFWDGYYLGQKLGEWNEHYGSSATVKKVYCGKVVKFFAKLSVAEVVIEATVLHQNDDLLITGPTTGALYCSATEIRYELEPVATALQGWHVSFPVPDKVRPNDKLFILVKQNPD